jgi:RNA polymerase sigma-70 factor (ECF subfamily)
VSETFLTAAETWGMKGMPPNPTAWLYAVAKQKTLYHFRRDKIFQQKIVPALSKEQSAEYEPGELNFSPATIRDSQLQMMFAICNPAIAGEAQIGLALRILCGFGIDEIAEAFLSNKETINKRLFRAKEKLRAEKVELHLPPVNEIANRLDNVLHIIYLLFNEGYYSKTNNKILQKEFCVEAMRLAMLLTEFPQTNLPKTNALISLMCFHASRFNARETDDETLILYDQQDMTLWDKGLIVQGIHFLDLATQGEEISSYHLEAKIAWWHCIKEDMAEKWTDILQCYNRLMRINYSPGVALNRVYAVYKVYGQEAALQEMEKLNMEESHFYYLLLGELYTNLDNELASVNFEKAYELARTQPEKQVIREKIDGLHK